MFVCLPASISQTAHTAYVNFFCEIFCTSYPCKAVAWSSFHNSELLQQYSVLYFRFCGWRHIFTWHVLSSSLGGGTSGTWRQLERIRCLW